MCAFVVAALQASRAQRFGPRQVDSLPSTPPRLVAHYGSDSLQFGELRLPIGRGPFPVAVVIHGGCWTAGFATVRNTAALASKLLDDGIATWNIEYRQAGNPGGGWPTTFIDIATGVDFVRTLAARYPLDLNRVIAVGHSAGAHLALWDAGRARLPKNSPIRGRTPLALRAAVAIDGPGDLAGLVGRDSRICGKPVIAPFMGGDSAARPDRYRQASPVEMLPIGTTQYLVAASVLTAVDARTYEARAKAVGDSVVVLVVNDAGHFDVIAPGRAAWAGVETLIRRSLGIPQ